jgi:hypothetical protein
MRKKILEYRRRLAQRYANFIIRRLETTIELTKNTEDYDGDMLFNFWLSQGYSLDQKMINKYEIYLD